MSDEHSVHSASMNELASALSATKHRRHLLVRPFLAVASGAVLIVATACGTGEATSPPIPASPAPAIGDFRITGNPSSGSQTTRLQASTIATPYQMHHGDADVVVSIASDRDLATLLTQRGVRNELVVYPGGSHADVAQSSVVLARVRQWYIDHGLFR